MDWAIVEPLPETISDIQGFVHTDDKIYLIGGFASNQLSNYMHPNVLQYDPVADTFTDLAALPTPFGSLNGVGAYHSGIIYWAGGYSYDSLLNVYELRKYNIGTNSWSTLTPIPYGCSNGAGVVLDDKIYIVGGRDETDSYHGRLQIYDILTDTWSAGLDLESAIQDHRVITDGTYIYVFGGYGSNIGYYLNYIQRYDPVTDTWDSGWGELDFRWLLFGIANLDDRYILIGGGYNGVAFNETTTVIIYDLQTQTYRPINSFPVRISPARFVLLDGNVYSFGGYDADVGTMDATYVIDANGIPPALATARMPAPAVGDPIISIELLDPNGYPNGRKALNGRYENYYGDFIATFSSDFASYISSDIYGIVAYVPDVKQHGKIWQLYIDILDIDNKIPQAEFTGGFTFDTRTAYDDFSWAGWWNMALTTGSIPDIRFRNSDNTLISLPTNRCAVISDSSDPDWTGIVSAPANDKFANATELSGASGFVVETNAGSSLQFKEEDISEYGSIWFKWTPDTDGEAFIHSFDSTPRGTAIVDTKIHVYTGTRISDLVLVTSNDDHTFPSQTDPREIYASYVTFATEVDTTYYIRVQGYYEWQVHDIKLTYNAGAPPIDVLVPLITALAEFLTLPDFNFNSDIATAIALMLLAGRSETIDSDTALALAQLLTPFIDYFIILQNAGWAFAGTLLEPIINQIISDLFGATASSLAPTITAEITDSTETGGVTADVALATATMIAIGAHAPGGGPGPAPGGGETPDDGGVVIENGVNSWWTIRS